MTSRVPHMAALMAALEPEIGVPLKDEWRPRVLAFLEMAAAAADQFADCALDEAADESASVFKPEGAP